ncbi:hypothetical protein ACFQ2B_23570 [Streptomyces stramineus]
MLDQNGEFSFDIDSAFRADPYPVYRELRAHHPLVRGPLGAWAVSRYEDCDALLRDRRMGKDLGDSNYFAQVAGTAEGSPRHSSVSGWTAGTPICSSCWTRRSTRNCARWWARPLRLPSSMP